MNKKGAMALANGFTPCPPDYQQRVESVAADAKSIMGAIAILDEIERELSQWYGDRRLVVQNPYVEFVKSQKSF